MNILVTGGAGFIGLNLVRWLLTNRSDAPVTNLDALTCARNLESLKDVEEDPRYTFLHGDICDAGIAAEVTEGMGLGLHLAAGGHVERSILADAPFVRSNVLGTQALLAAALALEVERFVHVCTDEIYGELPWRDPADGDPTAPRFTEDTPIAPRSPYSASKAASDVLALAYHTTHGMDVVVMRCSNNYGPYQFPEKLIPLMITLALEDRSLPVYGDGLHVRDSIRVTDHCRGIVAAAEQGQAGRAYKFGGDAERTNLTVVKAILRALGQPEDRIEHVKDRKGHDRRYAIEFSRAEKELGWRPSVTFEEGLADTVRWYLENEGWWRRVKSGEYWAYHREQYGHG